MANARIVASLFLFLLLPAVNYAQDRSLAKSMIGAQAGVSYSRLIGAQHFAFRYTDTRNGHSSIFQFDDLGSGESLILGLSLQVPFSTRWGMIARLSLLGLQTGSAETAIRPSDAGITGENVSTTNTLYTNQWNYTAIDLLTRYRWGTSPFYSTAGVSAGALVSNRFDAHQSILSSGSYNFQTGSGPKEYDLPNLRSDNYYNTYHFEAQFGIGYALTIPFLDNDVFTPEISVSVPLAQVFTPDALQRNSAQRMTTPNLFHANFTIGLSIPLGRDSEDAIPVTALDSMLRMKPRTLPDEGPPAGTSAISPVIAIHGEVHDVSGGPLRAQVIATNLDLGTTSATGTSDSSGHYTLPIPNPGRYSVTATAAGQLFRSVEISVEASAAIQEIAPIVLPPAKGRVPLLVFFGFNDATLKAESYPELFRIVHLLQSDTSIHIELDGHTDNVGSDDYNQGLSEKRANALKAFLLTHGVDARRVETKGFGRSKPVAENNTDEGRTKNRRVEMIVR